MDIVQKMQSVLDFQRHHVVFVLSHDDAGALKDSMERTSMQPVPPGPVYSWHFHGVPVQPADVRQSYIVTGWDQPTIHFL